MQKKVLADNKLYRQIVELAEEGIWMIDQNSITVFVNPKMASILGYSILEMIGKSIYDFMDEAAKKDAEESVRKRKNGLHENHEVRLKNKNGKDVWVWMASCPLLNQRGEYTGALALMSDITERKTIEEELQRSQNNLKLAQQVSKTGSWTIDLNKNQLIWTEETYRIFGLPDNTPLTYEIFMQCVHPDDRVYVDQQWKAAMAGEPYDIQHRIIVDGKIKWIRERADLKVDKNGNVIGGVGTAQDITDFRLTEEALKNANMKAESASRAKDMFLATLSHELRTPLTSILGWSQMLKRGLSPEKTETAIKVIEENAKIQNQLIEDLLDVSRIITGKLLIESKTSDLKEVFLNSIELIRPQADKKSLTIIQNITPSPVIANIDPVRMKQVFWNILVNAVKFSFPNGKIELSLNVDHHTNGGKAIIQIKDEGKGIASDFIPYLFDRFMQEDLTSMRQHGGLGIGLALARSLLHLQHGKIEAESQGEGKGSTFTIYIPLSDSDTHTNHEYDSSTDLKNIEILLVDNDDDSRIALGEILSVLGATVKLAATSKEALAEIKNKTPDVLMSDISMPDEDGYTLIKKIRSMEEETGSFLPAIAITAYAGTENRLKAIEAGYQEHISKPVDIDQIAGIIRNVLKMT